LKINPLLPAGDTSVIDGSDVEAIVLTNRHHLRDSERLAGGEIPLFGAPALVGGDLSG